MRPPLGEIRIFYDWISAQQEAYWREPLEVILKGVQLSLFGEIDPDIGFTFVPLYQMTPKEESDIRLQDSQADCAYVAAGIIDPSEVRDRLAKDPNSGFMGLDTSVELVNPDPQPGKDDLRAALDAEFNEGDHPRAANGQFGSGGRSAPKSSPAVKTEYGDFDTKRGTLGGAQLISSQDYLDDDKVSEKSNNGDYVVQISPEFEVDGEKYRVIVDGHHSLAAAIADGKTPEFEEQSSRHNDHIAALENGNVDDFLEQTHMGDDWRNRITGKSVF